jgi:hypothetical protein
VFIIPKQHIIPQNEPNTDSHAWRPPSGYSSSGLSSSKGLMEELHTDSIDGGHEASYIG